jgi:glycosyltransferase involved in cell wall biosynthesis
MQRPFNVLMVTAWPLDDPAGGVNTMVRTLAQRLRPACRIVRFEIDWNAPRLERHEADGDLRYALRLRGPYYRRRPLSSVAIWALAFPTVLSRLCRLIKAEAIDIVHLHYASPEQFYFRLARNLLGIPYVVTLHRGDVMSYPTLERPDRTLMRYAVDGAARVVAVSRSLADKARTTLGDLKSLEVIENGVDIQEIERFEDDDPGPGAEADLSRPFFLMVGNVTRYKAQDVAIRAWALVKEQHPDLPLFIVGGKREFWDECVRLIAELDCADSVKLLGACSRRAALNLMARATGLVIPSRSEGLPYVLLEAGVLGKPVVCSDIGPFIEVVKDGETALVTASDDHRELARAVLRLLAQPDRAREMGERLSHRVRSDFSARRMASRYLDLYRRVVEERPAL